METLAEVSAVTLETLAEVSAVTLETLAEVLAVTLETFFLETFLVSSHIFLLCGVVRLSSLSARSLFTGTTCLVMATSPSEGSSNASATWSVSIKFSIGEERSNSVSKELGSLRLPPTDGRSLVSKSPTDDGSLVSEEGEGFARSSVVGK